MQEFAKSIGKYFRSIKGLGKCDNSAILIDPLKDY